MTEAVVLQYTTPDYEFIVNYIPIHDGNRWYNAHIEVFKWSPRVLRDMKEVWPFLRRRIDAPLFAWTENEDAKWEKFISIFGFKYLDTFIGPDGKNHKFFLHI